MPVPGTCTRLRAAIEPLEDALPVAFRNRGTGIPDGDDDRAIVASSDADADSGRRRGIFQRIVQQLPDREQQQRPIGIHHHVRGRVDHDHDGRRAAGANSRTTALIDIGDAMPRPVDDEVT